MASGEPQPLYTIVGETPEVRRNADGTYTQAYRIDFRTALGQTSFVIVPRSANLDDDVHAAVQAEAEQLVSLRNRPTVPLYTSRSG